MLATLLISVFMFSCSEIPKKVEKSAAEILENSDYLAVSYGGYRGASHEVQPSIADLKEDMKLLEAML